MTLSLLYRGTLSSCNYACAYCPFAKRKEDRRALLEDRAALDRFVAWVESATGDELAILFTPWGEALVRKAYREALVHLSHLPNVRRVAIQTNLSTNLAFVERANRTTLAFWATYHPTEVSRARFVAQVRTLRELGARTSVGIVGLPAHREEAESLRRELPDDVYLWVNAAKRTHGTYSEDEVRFFERLDPHFRTNTVAHASVGRACATGVDTLSVDGSGTVRRCHFVPEALGNLYDGSFREGLGPKPCPNATCGCHIGYVHLAHLGLRDVYGDGVLERIPRVRLT